GQPVIITPFKPRQRPMRPPPGREPDRPENMPPTVRERPPLPVGSRVRGARAGLADTWRTRRGDVTLMHVAAPVRDAAGVVQGALALVINPDTEFTRILSVARSGKSGETYAFDQRGLMISQSRFDVQLRKLGLIEDRPGS